MVDEYVIKGERMKNYLYILGFDYREVIDNTHNQKVVWLFAKSDIFLEALTFYSKVKNILIINKDTKKQ